MPKQQIAFLKGRQTNSNFKTGPLLISTDQSTISNNTIKW